MGATRIGGLSWDAPPFPWLQDIITLVALYLALMILAIQRREDRLAAYRDPLELALLSEQKSVKIIQLPEEMHTESPYLSNRVDAEAAAMSTHADPSTVYAAIDVSCPRR